VQVRHVEGVAIRIDPKPCAVVRKDDSEALVGERTGQPLSLAKTHILGVDAVAKVSASVWTARRGRRTWHVPEARWAGTGRSHVWPVPQSTLRLGEARSRRPMMPGDLSLK
jgi:hypothetical protein